MINKISSYKKYIKHLHNPVVVFLIIGGFFGMLYILFVPPFLQPDEAAHFNRIYQISQGQIVGQRIPGAYGSYLPESINAFEGVDYALISDPTTQRTSINAVIKRIINPAPTINSVNLKRPIAFVNTEQYNPVVYAPQIFGMLLSRILNLSVAGSFYMIRLFGLIAWLIVCAYGIKKMKVFGWAAVVILLTPLCLQISSSVSADSMTIAFSVLLVGAVFDALTRKELTKRNIAVLITAVILIAFVKIPYQMLLALVVLIPSSKFVGSPMRKQHLLIATIAAVVLITGSWSFIAHRQYVSFRTLSSGVPLDLKTQENYLIHHPLSFGHKLYDTYLRSNPYTNDPVWAYVGVLGTTGYSLPYWVGAVYFMLFGGVFITLRNNAKRNDYLAKSRRIFIAILAATLFLAINAIVFITWSRIEIQIIEGVQSRYFIPLVVLSILMLLPIYKQKIALTKTFYWTVPVTIVIIQLATIVSVYYQYYAAPMPIVNI